MTQAINITMQAPNVIGMIHPVDRGKKFLGNAPEEVAEACGSAGKKRPSVARHIS